MRRALELARRLGIVPEAEGSEAADSEPLSPEVLDVLRRMNDLLDAPTGFGEPELDQTVVEDPALPPTRAEGAGQSGPEASASFGFGRFTDLKFLAEGGMGQILTATDPAIKRRVAIKILRPDIASHRAHLAKFKNEFELTGQLEHPGIVPVYDTGRTDDGRVYFCMKLVKGESLVAAFNQMCSQRNWRERLRMSAPGSRPASQRIWKPLQMPRTWPPSSANSLTAAITGL